MISRFLSRDRWWGQATNQLSSIELESEWVNFFTYKFSSRSKQNKKTGSRFCVRLCLQLHTIRLLSESRNQSDCSIWDRTLVDLYQQLLNDNYINCEAGYVGSADSKHHSVITFSFVSNRLRRILPGKSPGEEK